MSRLSDYDLSETFKCEVLESARMTPPDYPEEIRHIVLAVNKDEFDVQLGESVGVLAPGPHEFGNPYHLRLYTVAGHEKHDGRDAIALCVKRVFYIDDFSGERYPGKASNYLCNLRKGDTVTLTGPYPGPFKMPADPSANILMVGLGTGIAPFRAFVKHIYDEVGGWKGKVRLFYGAKTGMELVYMNDEQNDLAQYYDQETFKAFQAVSPRPYMDDPIALDRTLEENAAEVWALMQDVNTHVYVAGLEKVNATLERTLSKLAGSREDWRRLKEHMTACGRWMELLY